MDRKYRELRERLERRKKELEDRLERVTANVRRGYDADSEERAQQCENNEVVDALGNDARTEIARISAAIRRIDAGQYGVCRECELEIDKTRIDALPYAEFCIECAEFEEFRQAHR
jgi:RNA polymerase-binding transcription factor DksA